MPSLFCWIFPVTEWQVVTSHIRLIMKLLLPNYVLHTLYTNWHRDYELPYNPELHDNLDNEDIDLAGIVADCNAPLFKILKTLTNLLNVLLTKSMRTMLLLPRPISTHQGFHQWWRWVWDWRCGDVMLRYLNSFLRKFHLSSAIWWSMRMVELWV